MVCLLFNCNNEPVLISYTPLFQPVPISTAPHTDVPTAWYTNVLPPFGVCVRPNWQQPLTSVCNLFPCVNWHIWCLCCETDDLGNKNTWLGWEKTSWFGLCVWILDEWYRRELICYFSLLHISVPSKACGPFHQLQVTWFDFIVLVLHCHLYDNHIDCFPYFPLSLNTKTVKASSYWMQCMSPPSCLFKDSCCVRLFKNECI